jgi:two-component system sensor histidine kinase CreC
VVSDLSDLESRTQLTKASVNVASVVRDVVARFAHRAQARQLDVVASLPSQATATIDPGAVERAVAALLDNAVTYASAGSTIDVAVTVTSDCVDIHVRDTGCGIPASETSRLIRPFERGDHELQPVNSKGLGLAVAHTVATAHGGELLLQGRDPSGFCATLSLPRSDVGRRTPDQTNPS